MASTSAAPGRFRYYLDSGDIDAADAPMIGIDVNLAGAASASVYAVPSPPNAEMLSGPASPRSSSTLGSVTMEPSEPSGRGLRIVQELADSFGVSELRGSPGKTVWFVVTFEDQSAQRRPSASATPPG